jgi:methylthioribose-1-phosphate isomerase
MRVDGLPRRTIWMEDGKVLILDQDRLPHETVILELATVEDAARAIETMQVRGAPLIGVAAAFGLALAVRENPSDEGLADGVARLASTRPTAVNLAWALEQLSALLRDTPRGGRAAAAFERARAMADEDVSANRRLGAAALEVMVGVGDRVGRGDRPENPLRILTHCNAGWLATVDRGTATAGIYAARDAGYHLHVWVDETRPRGQGGRLTAWELGEEEIPHTVIPDTAAGHLMATGQVDMVVVGTDRVTANGDVVNKIGTYQVALAAADNQVPFYVAAPTSSVDATLSSGGEVTIEERSGDELRRVRGTAADGRIETVDVIPRTSPARNPAFDVTPARLVTALLNESGVFPASREGVRALLSAAGVAGGDPTG